MVAGVESVVQLYGVFEDEAHVSLVMEHCAAGDLFKTMLVHGGILDEHWVAVQARLPHVTPPQCHSPDRAPSRHHHHTVSGAPPRAWLTDTALSDGEHTLKCYGM